VTEETEDVEVAADEEGTVLPADDRTEMDQEAAGASTRESADQAAEVDDAADAFLELESQFTIRTLPGRVRGRAVDVERVPTPAVPADYPVEIRTDEALALAVEIDDERVPVYFAFDDDLTDGRLGRLLELKGISPERFADLYGETVLLTVEEGHYVPVVPEEDPRGSALGGYGVAGGLAMNLLAVALLVVGLGGVVSVPVVLAWLAANVLGVPAATYLDAWHLRTHTDWSGGPLFWTALGAIPGVNVLSSAAYLRQRARATEL